MEFNKTMVEEQIYMQLPEELVEIFKDVSLQRVLGATAHIKLIGKMITGIADDKDVKDKKVLIELLADYFINTRGKASVAIANAIKKMLDFTAENEPYESAVKTSVREYFQKSQENTDKILAYSKNLFESMKTVMLFDYSSTVGDAFFKSGLKLNYIIPESRILDGGRPYIKQLYATGSSIKVIPDSAIYHYLKECDAAFIGAETFYPDGTVFNTTGAEMTAILCKMLGKGFYVLTPLIKLDGRSLYGFDKKPVNDDMRKKFALEDYPEVDCVCPELIPVKPEYVTAYVTEIGIIPPYALYSYARDYLKE